MSLVSLKRIISDFNGIHHVSTSDWKVLAVNEWLPKALGLIGVRTNYTIGKKTECATQFRVALPCGKNNIFAAIYQGQRLPIKRGIPYAFKKEMEYYDIDTFNKIDLYEDIGHTTFETGDVTFLYLDFPKDDEGVIMIPDVEQLHDALLWYLTYVMILSQRLKHPEITLSAAMNMWEDKAASSRNYMSFPSPEKMMEWKTLRNNGLLYNVDENYFEI